MIISYIDIYSRYAGMINRVNSKKQARISKNIYKLQEWFDEALRQYKHKK